MSEVGAADARRADLRNIAGSFLAATMFLTRLPVPRWTPHAPTALARCTVWFPVVGAVVGAVAGAIYAASALLFSPLLCSVIAIATSVLVTGGLHEDALADAADGLGGGRTPDRALEIMRDSRVGAYGVVAVVLMVLGRVASITEIGAAGGSAVAGALIAAHALARCSSVHLIWRLPYVRGAGAVSPFAGGVSFTRVSVATATALLIAAAAGPSRGAAATAVALLVTIAAGAYFRRRLAGITGDCLGAANQVVELATYLVILALR